MKKSLVPPKVVFNFKEKTRLISIVSKPIKVVVVVFVIVVFVTKKLGQNLFDPK